MERDDVCRPSSQTVSARLTNSVSDDPRPWDLLNPEQIQNWMDRSAPGFGDIREVVELIGIVLSRAPEFGLKMTVIGGNPVYHALTKSGRVSVTWSLFDERTGNPTAVYIRQIETFDDEPIQ